MSGKIALWDGPYHGGRLVSLKSGIEPAATVDGPMETLYLLIEIEVGRLDEVLARLRTIPHVVEVQAVTGPFDLIAKVQAEHINEALDVVIGKIRRIAGIKGTETLVTVSAG